MVIAGRKKIFLFITLLVIACLAAFGRTAGNDFINYDDDGYITENFYVQHGINQKSIKWAFTSTNSSNWHPLTWLSHTLDWRLFGASASGHHFINLLLHIGTVLFLFLFLNKTTNNIRASAFAAAFFALHPLRVESVAWAAERKDVLSLFFGMACIYAYAFYAKNSKLTRYLLCLILFSFGLMSKPMIVSLPFLLMLLDFWPLGRWQKTTDERGINFHSVSRLFGEKIPFILLTVAVSILTFWAQNKEGTVASIDSLPFIARISNAVVSYVTYLGKIFLPVNLAVLYPYKFPLPLWKVLISGIILVVITSAVMYYIKKMPFLFSGWFWYLGSLVPVIGLVQSGSQAMADRYTYLPSVGIAFGMTWVIQSFIKNEDRRKKILFPTGIAVLGVLSILTFRQCGYWKDSVTLFSHTLNVTNENALVHNQLGLAFFEKNKNREAIYHYDRAIALQPLQDSAYNNRGAVYLKYGRYQQALNDFNRAISINPSHIKAYNNRAIVYDQTGNYELAIEDLGKAVRLNPHHATTFYNRGFIFAKFGRYQNAISDFNQVIILNPNYADAYNNRAIVYWNTGNIKAGCDDAKKACELGSCTVLQNARNKGLCS
ncbi:MAG: tetratricopeptide repeat protein [Syntrophaceae bacterium]|nr:tetratricopeptide repeat protein [Syntrophaceae bacterium]